MHYDLLVYAAHLTFWLVFVAGDFRARRLSRSSIASSSAVHDTGEPLTAAHSRLLIALHMVAFGVTYLGIERALFHSAPLNRAPIQRLLGTAIILAGAVLMYMARVAFASWRFRAQIDTGHQLATTGPFRFIRHPLYAGLDLLALGTAVWISTPMVWLGALIMTLAGDLRARAEEPLLERAFGDTYRAYSRRTWRFLPRVY